MPRLYIASLFSAMLNMGRLILPSMKHVFLELGVWHRIFGRNYCVELLSAIRKVPARPPLDSPAEEKR